MKISKVVLVSLIALSVICLSACGTQNADTSSQASVTASSNEGSTDNSSSTVDEKSEASEKTESSVDTESGRGDAQPNQYGYVALENPPASSISVAALSGSWLDTGIGTEVLTVNEGGDLYNGTFSFRNDEAKITTGYVKLEQDSDNTVLYTFYTEDGTLWNAFVADGSVPLDSLTSALEGGAGFVRQDNNTQNQVSAKDYEGTYTEEVAGRGVITLSVDEDGVGHFHVRWPGSASEVAEWDFSGTLVDNNSFPYENGVKTVKQYDEDGKETVTEEYTNGAGSIIFETKEDGTSYIRWNDEIEKIADDAVFVKQ